jgi:hypothetical protein
MSGQTEAKMAMGERAGRNAPDICWVNQRDAIVGAAQSSDITTAYN